MRATNRDLVARKSLYAPDAPTMGFGLGAASYQDRLCQPRDLHAVSDDNSCRGVGSRGVKGPPGKVATVVAALASKADLLKQSGPGKY